MHSVSGYLGVSSLLMHLTVRRGGMIEGYKCKVRGVCSFMSTIISCLQHLKCKSVR